MDELLARLRTQLQGLTPRERLLLLGVGLLAGLSLLWFGLVSPVLSARSDAVERARAAEQELETVRRLRAQYAHENVVLADVERRIQQGPSGNLLTALETMAQNAGAKVESMEPQAAGQSERYRETKVQLVLKGVTLAQTVNYLQQIESASQPLSIKNLRLRVRTDDPELLDVTFTVSSFEAV